MVSQRNINLKLVNQNVNVASILQQVAEQTVKSDLTVMATPEEASTQQVRLLDFESFESTPAPTHSALPPTYSISTLDEAPISPFVKPASPSAFKMPDTPNINTPGAPTSFQGVDILRLHSQYKWERERDRELETLKHENETLKHQNETLKTLKRTTSFYQWFIFSIVVGFVILFMAFTVFVFFMSRANSISS